MSASQIAGWLALALVPLTALAAWTLRRLKIRAPVMVRMRLHFMLGYCALAAALFHASTTMKAMGGANATGLTFGTIGLFGFALQAFVGANLQSPGIYRKPLRRWHLMLFAGVLAIALAHVFLNASFIGAAPDPQ